MATFGVRPHLGWVDYIYVCFRHNDENHCLSELHLFNNFYSLITLDVYLKAKLTSFGLHWLSKCFMPFYQSVDCSRFERMGHLLLLLFLYSTVLGKNTPTGKWELLTTGLDLGRKDLAYPRPLLSSFIIVTISVGTGRKDKDCMAQGHLLLVLKAVKLGGRHSGIAIF